MIIRFFRRQRAARKLVEAKSRVSTLTRQIDANRKSHKPSRPLLGSLQDARRAMLEAEIELRGL